MPLPMLVATHSTALPVTDAPASNRARSQFGGVPEVKSSMTPSSSLGNFQQPHRACWWARECQDPTTCT
ncbi:hypothetical protein [Janibacter massiliensis]|uniref:hypothetical protein n=1 Tax=Janibacter massiliensis TaxID=2058291 RepID=UPI000D101A85|nr:hypothetical protein [Janibacter massiliensis]